MVSTQDAGIGTDRPSPLLVRLAKDFQEDWLPSHWVDMPHLQRDEEDELAKYIRSNRPCQIRGTGIVPVSRWQDLSFLRQTMSKTKVLVKSAMRDRVAYFQTDKNAGRYDFEAEEFVREYKVTFNDFLAGAEEVLKYGSAGGARSSSSTSKPRKGRLAGETLYCQESFVGHPELQAEFGSWDWTWALLQTKRHGWGLPETNVLFMGTRGATTPCHFDEQHNFLNQVRGHKLVVLFPPDDYPRMYPFPVTHPCDRVSMVDVRNPDLERFPRFAEVRGHVALLGPGDILYIPTGWWHYCRTLTHLGASITFWSQVAPVGPSCPGQLTSDEWTRVRRNLEKILAEDVGGPKLQAEVLRMLDVLKSGRNLDDSRVVAMRKMLSILGQPEEEQIPFLLETFDGRFGLDYNLWV